MRPRPSDRRVSPTRNHARWRPLALESLELRCLMSATPADAAFDPPLEPPFAHPTLVEVSLEVTDESGNRIDHVDVGDAFRLRVLVQDVRDGAEGVFSLYTDILYDSALVQVDGEIQYNDSYPGLARADTTAPGRVNEGGGFSYSLRPLGPDARELFSIPMRATAEGTALLSADSPECRPFTDVGVYGSDQPVSLNAIAYGALHLKVGSAATPAVSLSQLAAAAPDNCTIREVAIDQLPEDVEPEPRDLEDLLGYTEGDTLQYRLITEVSIASPDLADQAYAAADLTPGSSVVAAGSSETVAMIVTEEPSSWSSDFVPSMADMPIGVALDPVETTSQVIELLDEVFQDLESELQAD